MQSSIAVSIAIAVLLVHVVAGSPARTITTRALAPIDSAGLYQAEWTVQGQTITFNLVVETLGFIGFGFAPNGTMAGADIVIGGVLDANATSYFSDRHGTGHTEPIVDPQQNYQLLSASQNGTHTNLAFQRALNTGDAQNDVVITNSNVTLIWAYGATDVVEYHFANRGQYVTNLLQ